MGSSCQFTFHYMMDQNNSTIRTYMAIMAERDAAILERNLAIDERKRALAERDMAMLQRDAAISERNSAIQERNEAIAALQFQDTAQDESNITHYPHHNHQHPHQMVATSVDPVPAPETSIPRKVKRQPNESREFDEEPSKLPRVLKEESFDWQAVSAFNDWADGGGNHGEFVDPGEEEEEEEREGKPLQDSWDPADVSGMPTAVCSCTGTPRQCYKWGNGGWQSACCTTTISMYPLPQASDKRYSRVGGRKMSGKAFSKLLGRLTAEGYDMSAPLDLKDHWAKHGTKKTSILPA